MVCSKNSPRLVQAAPNARTDPNLKTPYNARSDFTSARTRWPPAFFNKTMCAGGGKLRVRSLAESKCVDKQKTRFGHERVLTKCARCHADAIESARCLLQTSIDCSRQRPSLGPTPPPISSRTIKRPADLHAHATRHLRATRGQSFARALEGSARTLRGQQQQHPSVQPASVTNGRRRRRRQDGQ